MTTLLPFDSPLYLKRLARELSYRPAGFYHDGERWNLARFSRGVLVISRTVGFNVAGQVRRKLVHKTFASVPQYPSLFDDGQGNGICASRTP